MGVGARRATRTEDDYAMKRQLVLLALYLGGMSHHDVECQRLCDQVDLNPGRW